MVKKQSKKEDSKLRSALKHDEDSRNSTNGYLETGNPAEAPALARAVRNNDNGSHI